jgi:hypothetical protein
MSRLSCISVLFLVACGAFAQTASRPTSSGIGSVIWKPPAWNSLRVAPKATVAKEMLATLRVSNFSIVLEKTNIEAVKKNLGGTFGQMGDGGDADEWLCFHGTDSSGSWALWLESGEIDGGMVGGFQWQRFDNSAVFDRRCRMLGDAKVELPNALRLDITEAEVVQILGQPTVRQSNRLIYIHDHKETIRGEPFDSSNIVAVLLLAGRVRAIEVSKTTSS